MNWSAKVFLAIVFACGGGSGARASTDLVEIANLVQSAPVVRADFSQARDMEVLTRPLISEGEVLFVSGKGVAWLVRKPYPVNFVLTQTHVTEWSGEGVRRRTPLASQPSLGAVVGILVPLLSADFESLSRDFFVSADTNDKDWQIDLVPKGGVAAAIVTEITVTGSAYINELMITEKSGDQTKLVFSNYQAKPGQLSSEERGYFD